MSKYFTPEETVNLSPKLIEMLDLAREIAGIPFVITSGYRDPTQNELVGGVPDSAHEKGLAVDIRAPNDQIGKMIAFGLGQAGFKRAGFYDKHIHVDIDETKPLAKWQGVSH